MHSLPATSGLPMPYLHSPVESFVSPTWPAQPGGLPRHMLPALPAIIIPRGYHLSPDLPQQQLPLPAETVHPTQSHLDALIRHGLACEQDSHRISAHLVRSHAQLPYPIPTNQAAQSVIPQYTRAQPSSSSASHHRAPLTSSIPATVATTPADTSQSIPVSPTSYCTCQFGSRGAGVAVSPAPASTSSSHRSESEYAATSFQEYLPASSHAQLTSLEHIYRPDFAPHHQ
ncbi:hypothetical protein E5Q_00197 [Mixia osmundae IAM 14324]|uniref:Uncharacterized protein n=2 Tax=Mixia osmundae (strain CBS 9802 / IAM 14324 / JCM 22182 / KY 12970) TaxID=764103 RepID=G7DSJ3_MIXOS|nr:hypothetical protein E5Q_00197 [Mixia osmundae IAM 14324]